MTNDDSEFDIQDPSFVASCDDLSLWSALAGTVLLDHLPMGPFERVLDVGCGTGFPLIELAGRFGPACQVTGLDTWKEAIERARQKIKTWGLPNAEANVDDASAMDFDDDTFDLVVSNLGINNFSKPESVTKECARVLKPRGTLALTTNLRGHMDGFYDAFTDVLKDLNETKAIESLNHHISTRMSHDELVNLLESADFSVDVVERKTGVLRYSSWEAFWTHPFVRLAFKEPWLAIAEQVSHADVVALVRQKIVKMVADEGELRLSIPIAYVEARAP